MPRLLFLSLSLLLTLFLFGRAEHSPAQTVADSAQPAAVKFTPDRPAFEKQVVPFFRAHCLRCHGPDKQEGAFRVDQMTHDLTERHDAEKWLELLNRINKGEMPPADEPQPKLPEQELVVDWIAEQLRRAAEVSQSTGGKVVLRRMNRAEYNNTIRDLVGIDFAPAQDFPEDPPAFGFDNIGNALSISPLHFEKYMRAAREIMDRAIVTGDRPQVRSWHMEVEDAHRSNKFEGRQSAGQDELWVPDPHTDRHRFLIKGGGLEVRDGWVLQKGSREEAAAGFRWFRIPEPGVYIIRVKAAGVVPSREEAVKTAMAIKQQDFERELARESGAEKQARVRDRWDRYIWPGFKQHLATASYYNYGAPRLKLSTERGDIIGEISVEAPRDQPEVYEFKFEFHPQPREMDGVNLVNTYSVPPEAENFTFLGRPEFARPELWIDWVELEGPVVPDWPLPSHRQILFDSPQRQNEPQYARQVLERFMLRAFRRPLRAGEVDEMLALFDSVRSSKSSFDEAIKVPLMAVLCSPHFLYLVEPVSENSTARRSLDDWELAGRLSYFLWSSQPDDELFALAERGELHRPEVLTAQVDRMLADPKSEAFVQNFAGQWLGLRQVGANPPSRDLFPRYDPHLQESIILESQAFFAEILRNDLDVKNFLKSDFVVINERLARFYAIPGVKGDHFRRVDVGPEHHRGGLVTQASVLTITSNGTRTSPVIRGKWILENLLGDPPPPPPPDAGDIAPKVPGIDKATVRVRLEAHRKISACASCHAKIDPLGFALENFNADGAWRDHEGFGYKGRVNDNDPAIDPSGRLPDGSEFKTFEEFQTLLLREEDRFLDCLIEKLTTYALGRGIEFSDRPQLEQFRQQMKTKDPTLRHLLKLIVTSDSFLTK